MKIFFEVSNKNSTFVPQNLTENSEMFIRKIL
jgi:hypothetical protein